MKKAVVIFLFSIISVFSVGSFFLHMGYLSNYKQEFKEHLRQHQKDISLKVVHISPSQLYVNTPSVTWLDDNQEIVYKGILYDIVCIKNNGVNVDITLVSDQQQMDLQKEFADNYDADLHHGTKGPFQLLKKFFALKYIGGSSEIAFVAPAQNTSSLDMPQTLFIPKMILSRETPPPDMCV